jgi:energy-coupling factor transporter ATP-binding protein EcfA2
MIISIFGKPGSGKTTLLRSILGSLKKATGKPVHYWSPYTTDHPDPNFLIETNSIVGISEFHLFNSLYLDTFGLRFIFTGHRHLNLDIVIDSQRPAMVPRDVTALSDHIYCFQITEKRDIEYLVFYSEKAYDLPNLRKYQYIDILH